MKRLLVLVPAFLLAGCLATPVKREFPKVPEELTVACPDLKTVDTETTKLSTVITVVTDNYATYHECRLKVDAWRDWYKTQKEIFDSVE